MKIHAICLARNECDVVEDCLVEACTWADRIYVYDGASSDGTWEKVKALQSEKIVPWRSDNAVFREGLRAEVFEAFRKDSAAGDWWCQLNADEFYIENPREFLSGVPLGHHMVWAVNLQYYITERDLEAGPFSGSFSRDRQRLRYYKAACAEPRFFRYRERLQWGLNDAWPAHAGVIHGQTMHFRHYPYRSPEQIQTRLDVRRDSRKRGFEGWDHAKEETWREKIVPSAMLHCEEEGRPLIVEDDVRRQARETPARRLTKTALHTLGIWP